MCAFIAPRPSLLSSAPEAMSHAVPALASVPSTDLKAALSRLQSLPNSSVKDGVKVDDESTSLYDHLVEVVRQVLLSDSAASIDLFSEATVAKRTAFGLGNNDGEDKVPVALSTVRKAGDGFVSMYIYIYLWVRERAEMLVDVCRPKASLWSTLSRLHWTLSLFQSPRSSKFTAANVGGWVGICCWAFERKATASLGFFFFCGF